MLSNHPIPRSSSNLTILKLKVILHNDTAHNRLDRIRRKESSWTRLAPEPKVHIRRTDTDETG